MFWSQAQSFYLLAGARADGVAASVVASPLLELVAGCDILPEKREAFCAKWELPSSCAFADVQEMIAATQPDLVAVCTAACLPKGSEPPSPTERPDSHVELTCQVAALGVPLIFCEKAMASSMAGADRILAACREHGTRLNVGTSRRFDNRWHAVRAAIENGSIGELQGLQQFGGSSLMHGHIHTIDTMTYLNGDAKIARVRGDLEADTPPITANHLAADPRCVSYQLQYANGVVATSVPSGGAL